MNASDLNLMEFLAKRKVKFAIPVYQRNYDWKREHCQQLLDDIILCGQDEKIKGHFLGSIVYIHNNVFSMSKVQELTIIDGQQRLTTVTLIWIAIYKLAKKLNRIDLMDDIYDSTEKRFLPSSKRQKFNIIASCSEKTQNTSNQP